MAIKTAKKKAKQKYPIIRLCIKANFNNSIVTATDLEGKVIAWSSSGKIGFKGTKKSTPFAAQKATEELLEKVKEFDSSSAHLLIRGAGMGRDAFLRAVQSSGIQIESIRDVTGFPFGGVRPKPRRRV
jgi:small subunit ribosomal protein S11